MLVGSKKSGLHYNVTCVLQNAKEVEGEWKEDLIIPQWRKLQAVVVCCKSQPKLFELRRLAKPVEFHYCSWAKKNFFFNVLCIKRKVRSGVTRSKTCQNSSGCGQNAAPSAAVGCQICYNILALGRRPGWRQTAVNTAAIILASSNLATRQPDDLDEITAQLPTWMRVVQFPPSALKKGNKLDWCPLWCHRIRRKKDKLSY